MKNDTVESCKRAWRNCYPSFHVLEFVFEIGEAEGGRRQELFGGRNEAIASHRHHLALRSMIFQLFFNSFQTAAQLIHFLLQFRQTKNANGTKIQKMSTTVAAGCYLTLEARFKWGRSSSNFSTSLNCQ